MCEPPGAMLAKTAWEGGAAVTVTETTALLESMVAVMRATPGPTPVTTPPATVAIDALDDDQTADLPVIVAPVLERA